METLQKTIGNDGLIFFQPLHDFNSNSQIVSLDTIIHFFSRKITKQKVRLGLNRKSVGAFCVNSSSRNWLPFQFCQGNHQPNAGC